MNELKILLKYLGLSITNLNTSLESNNLSEVLSKNTNNKTQKFRIFKMLFKDKRKNQNEQKSPNYSAKYIFTLLLGSLPIGFLFYIFNFRIYRSLYDSLKFFPQYSQIGNLFYLTNITIFSLFYIVGFVGTGMYAFSMNEEMEFLLTLPISKRTLTIYNLILSLSNQLFTLIFLLAAIFGYMFGFKVFSVSFILRTFAHIYFLTSVSSLVAVLFGGLSSKKSIRVLNIFILLFTIFIYFGLSYFQDIDFTQTVQTKDLESAIRWMTFSTSNMNILVWAYSENNLYLATSIIISIFTSILFWYYSGRTIFENNHSRKMSRSISKEMSNLSSKRSSNRVWNERMLQTQIRPFLSKDLKLLMRNDQFIFLVLYPSLFGLFMMFISKNVLSSITPFIAIAVFYSAVESGIITMNEFKYKDILETLPVNSKNVILPKLLIPVTLNASLLFLIILISAFFKHFESITLVYFLLSLLQFYLSGMLGAFYSITKPGKKANQPFDMQSAFITQGLSIGLIMGMFIPLSILFSKTPSTQKSWFVYVLWLILIACIIITFVLILVYYKKLKTVLEEKD
ncbi:MAG: hypothetical protein ACK4R7_00235 [Fervidobacterium sp.]